MTEQGMYPWTSLLLVCSASGMPYLVLGDTQAQNRFTIEPPHDASMQATAIVSSLEARQSWENLLRYMFVAYTVQLLAVGITSLSVMYLSLKILYNHILDALLDIWAQTPPRNQVVIEAGSVRWEFGCTVIEPVPWESIRDYYTHKRDAVDRGFAPGYEKQWYFINEDRNRRCYVAMRIADVGKTIVPPKRTGGLNSETKPNTQ